MSIQLVIFDMAGTTVHDEDFVNLCLQAAMKSEGISVSRDEVNDVMGMPKPVAIRILMEKKMEAHEVTDEKNEALYQIFLQKMLEFYQTSEQVREIDGATQVFEQLRNAGIKVALDTGFSRVIADTIIEKLGWKAMLDTSVTSDEVPNGRPHPDLGLRAMELLGITDAKTVVKVGDTPSDLGEGTAIGCQYVIGVTSGASTKEELEAHPHTHILGSIREIPALLGIA